MEATAFWVTAKALVGFGQVREEHATSVHAIGKDDKKIVHGHSIFTAKDLSVWRLTTAQSTYYPHNSNHIR